MEHQMEYIVKKHELTKMLNATRSIIKQRVYYEEDYLKMANSVIESNISEANYIKEVLYEIMGYKK